MNNGSMNSGNGGFPTSSVAPTPKSNKKTLFLLLGVLVVVIVGVVIFLLLNNKGESKSSNTNSTSNSNTNMNQEEANDYYVDWIGTYESGDYILRLYYGNYKELTFNITLFQLVEGQEIPNTSIKASSFDIPVSSATQISYEYELFDSNITIQLEKTATGVKLVADSDDEDSVLYHLNLELTKKEFASNNWTGVYQKGNTLIVISEYDEDQICVLVSKETSVLPYYSENHPTTLMLEGISATITKTDTGITVTTTGDLSGDYQKK